MLVEAEVVYGCSVTILGDSQSPGCAADPSVGLGGMDCLLTSTGGILKVGCTAIGEGAGVGVCAMWGLLLSVLCCVSSKTVCLELFICDIGSIKWGG